MALADSSTNRGAGKRKSEREDNRQGFASLAEEVERSCSNQESKKSGKHHPNHCRAVGLGVKLIGLLSNYVCVVFARHRKLRSELVAIDLENRPAVPASGFRHSLSLLSASGVTCKSDEPELLDVKTAMVVGTVRKGLSFDGLVKARRKNIDVKRCYLPRQCVLTKIVPQLIQPP